jgi:hypothetical protein
MYESFRPGRELLPAFPENFDTIEKIGERALQPWTQLPHYRTEGEGGGAGGDASSNGEGEQTGPDELLEKVKEFNKNREQDNATRRTTRRR